MAILIGTRVPIQQTADLSLPEIPHTHVCGHRYVESDSEQGYDPTYNRLTLRLKDIPGTLLHRLMESKLVNYNDLTWTVQAITGNYDYETDAFSRSHYKDHIRTVRPTYTVELIAEAGTFDPIFSPLSATRPKYRRNSSRPGLSTRPVIMLAPARPNAPYIAEHLVTACDYEEDAMDYKVDVSLSLCAILGNPNLMRSINDAEGLNWRGIFWAGTATNYDNTGGSYFKVYLNLKGVLEKDVITSRFDRPLKGR